MESPYFAMLYSQKGELLIPMVKSNGDLAMFASPKECRDAAEQTTLGANFGYEVFCQGEGV